MLNVAIVGLGRIGQIHLNNLLHEIPQVNVVGAIDPSEELLAFAKKVGISHVGTDFEELEKIENIDAVFICSPTDTHADFIERSSNAGWHCFCEKPVDMDYERVQEVLRVVEKNNTKLMVAFNRRFDNGFRKVRDRVLAGDLEDMFTLKITSRDPAPPPVSYIERSGGLFMDMMIHDFDMARFIVGSEVVSVFTAASNLLDPEIGKAGDVDTAIVTLKFANGVIGTIDNCRQSAYGYDQRLEVHGKNGMLQANNLLEDNHQFFGSTSINQSTLQNFFLERYAQAYKSESVSFISSILNNEEPEVTGVDGLEAMRLAIAAKKSLDENREVFMSDVCS